MSTAVDSKTYEDSPHVEEKISKGPDSTHYDEKPEISAMKQGAMDAENAEHNMGVIEAVKLYPMAAFWAFTMSCTIVS